jgi:tRNA (cytidine56-2'-O)-methyltransferase
MILMKLVVLRLGHRIGRDKRISTHACLVARAFGAVGLIYTGESDEGMEKSVASVVERWGGKFFVRHEKSWKKVMGEWKGVSVHLTVYGLPVQDMIGKIRKSRKAGKGVLVVIGGEKVPSEVYHTVDHNVSVTSQPHSEVAALSVFLDRLLDGKHMNARFARAKLKVVPQERGKKVLGKD